MAELQPIIVFHGRHFVRHLGICNLICVKLLELGKGDRREDGAAVWANGMTFRRLTRQLKVQRISYLKYFHDPSSHNLTINCALVMVNLFGRHSIWRLSLTDIYSGLTPSTSRGYNTVSMSSLYDPTRLRTDSGVLFEWRRLLGAGLI